MRLETFFRESPQLSALLVALCVWGLAEWDGRRGARWAVPTWALLALWAWIAPRAWTPGMGILVVAGMFVALWGYNIYAGHVLKREDEQARHARGPFVPPSWVRPWWSPFNKR